MTPGQAPSEQQSAAPVTRPENVPMPPPPHPSPEAGASNTPKPRQPDSAIQRPPPPPIPPDMRRALETKREEELARALRQAALNPSAPVVPSSEPPPPSSPEPVTRKDVVAEFMKANSIHPADEQLFKATLQREIRAFEQQHGALPPDLDPFLKKAQLTVDMHNRVGPGVGPASLPVEVIGMPPVAISDSDRQNPNWLKRQLNKVASSNERKKIENPEEWRGRQKNLKSFFEAGLLQDDQLDAITLFLTVGDGRDENGEPFVRHFIGQDEAWLNFLEDILSSGLNPDHYGIRSGSSDNELREQINRFSEQQGVDIHSDLFRRYKIAYPSADDAEIAQQIVHDRIRLINEEIKELQSLGEAYGWEQTGPVSPDNQYFPQLTPSQVAKIGNTITYLQRLKSARPENFLYKGANFMLELDKVQRDQRGGIVQTELTRRRQEEEKQRAEEEKQSAEEEKRKNVDVETSRLIEVAHAFDVGSLREPIRQAGREAQNRDQLVGAIRAIYGEGAEKYLNDLARAIALTARDGSEYRQNRANLDLLGQLNRFGFGMEVQKSPPIHRSDTEPSQETRSTSTAKPSESYRENIALLTSQDSKKQISPKEMLRRLLSEDRALSRVADGNGGYREMTDVEFMKVFQEMQRQAPAIAKAGKKKAKGIASAERQVAADRASEGSVLSLLWKFLSGQLPW